MHSLLIARKVLSIFISAICNIKMYSHFVQRSDFQVSPKEIIYEGQGNFYPRWSCYLILKKMCIFCIKR